MNKKNCLAKYILFLLLFSLDTIHPINENSSINKWLNVGGIVIVVGFSLTAFYYVLNGINSLNKMINDNKIIQLKETASNGSYNEPAASFRKLEQRADQAIKNLDHLVDYYGPESASVYLAHVEQCIDRKKNENLDEKSKCFSK